MFIFFIITLINHARKILTIKTEVVKIISFNLDVAKYFPNIDITNPWIIYNSKEIPPRANKYLLSKFIFFIGNYCGFGVGLLEDEREKRRVRSICSVYYFELFVIWKVFYVMDK